RTGKNACGPSFSDAACNPGDLASAARKLPRAGRDALVQSPNMPPEPAAGPIDASLSQADRAAILRAAVGIGLYAGAFGASFGAVSVGSGLSVVQTMLLSLVMFTGASQFAFVGVIATGGSPFAAVAAALLLAVR